MTYTKMDKTQAWQNEKLVDEIDELIAKTFYDTDQSRAEGGPLHCYLMLAALLREMGQYSPGLDVNQLGQELQEYIGVQKLREVESSAERIAQKIFSIVKPTYTAVSYWSPIDERRHTVLYREAVRDGEDENHILAYSYAFYALTFSGRNRGYYSATQYTVDKAKRKRGVRVSYRESEVMGAEASNANNWWHVPRSSHEDILADVGLTGAVEDCLLSGEVPTQALWDTLNLMLLNKRNSPVGLNKFTRRFFDGFPERARSVTERTREWTLKTQTYVNHLFEADLNEEQALFMLMTNLIYDRAFPSTYFYAFPVRINKLCSVMTFGTDAALNPLQYLCLTRIANSILMHPLLLDYATKESEAIKSTSKMLLMSGFAHSANNALRMADIDSLVSLLSSDRAIKQDRFGISAQNSEDASYGLSALKMGGRVAQSFIALIEMLTRPGHLRKKFTSDRSYTLDECVKEAMTMVAVHVEGQEGYLPRLDAECSRHNWVKAELPEGYLDYVYVYTLLYELLLNVCKFSPTERKGGELYTKALISTRFDGENLEIHIRNRVNKETKWDRSGSVALPKVAGESEQSRKSFLQFAGALSTHISGITITSSIHIHQKTGEKYYEAVLSLGPMLVETSEGKTHRVGPILSAP